jgi:hypothetical protein
LHIEFLVEDKSGEIGLKHLVPRIVREDVTFNIHSYRGIGRIPKRMTSNTDPSKRFLLDQLVKLLRGYGKAFASYPTGYKTAVVVVCDLDSRNRNDFERELHALLYTCNPKPTAFFTLAVEEFEAWLLGDKSTIESNYPGSKQPILSRYQYDSICGTWETLADAIYPGGSEKLKTLGYSSIGGEKIKWAEKLCPVLNRTEQFSKFLLLPR